jgi:multicomponent Na+:H+ antiporter subunit B
VTPSFGSPVLGTMVRLLTPFLLTFSAYVAVHGHTSPGGGFQAGAALGSGLILIRLVGGPGTWGLSREAALRLACAGCLAYAWIGWLSLAYGAPAFDYSALPLPAEGAARRALGSLGIELGVLVTVSSVMVLIFDSLSSRREA